MSTESENTEFVPVITLKLVLIQGAMLDKSPAKEISDDAINLFVLFMFENTTVKLI